MLYGWLEVGASNIATFSNQGTQDIILRTSGSNNKIMLGNQMYDITSGSTTNAAIYVYGNNVGLNVVPASNIQLDIHGSGRIDNKMIFTDAITPTAPTASVMSSNSAFYIQYGNADRMSFTASNGIQCSDTFVSSYDIFAPAFNVTSDSNLKRDITDSRAEVDLNTVCGINVYDYRMKNSSNTIKGFIAQQVEQVFPQAISRTLGYLPSGLHDIYISKDGRILESSIILSIEIGEMLCVSYAKIIYELIVYKKMDGYVLVAGDTSLFDKNITVTGKKGFIRNIDVNQILALSINSIKLLTERIQRLEQLL